MVLCLNELLNRGEDSLKQLTMGQYVPNAFHFDHLKWFLLLTYLMKISDSVAFLNHTNFYSDYHPLEWSDWWNRLLLCRCQCDWNCRCQYDWTKKMAIFILVEPHEFMIQDGEGSGFRLQ